MGKAGRAARRQPGAAGSASGSPPASVEVVEEWQRRIEAEYRSTAVASNLALWLVQIAASPDLVRAALRIAREELGHAVQSQRVFVAARRACHASHASGPAARPLAIDRATLELPRTPGDPLELDVVRVCVQVFCLGETVAVRLFQELRKRCDLPVARRVLDRVLLDEVGHRDFGWTLLRWLLEHPVHGTAARRVVEAELPSAVQRIQEQYGPAALQAHAALPAADQRWGLMPAARYGQVLHATLERDYVPRFKALGITLPPPPGPLASPGPPPLAY